MPGQGNLVGLEGTRSLLTFLKYIFYELILAYILTSLKLIMIF